MYNKAKVKELLLLLIAKKGNRLESSTLMNKLLFLCNYKFLIRTGKPLIKGIPFKNTFYGFFFPDLETLIEELTLTGQITISKESINDKEVNIYKLNYVPSFKYLNREELDTLDDILRPYLNKSIDDILNNIYDLDIFSMIPYGEILRF